MILYGSRAKGNFREGSNIDLSIDSKELSYAQLLRIETEIDDLNMPYKVDLSILRMIDNQNLVEHIARYGVEFYMSKDQ